MLWGWGQAAQEGTTIGLLIHLKGRDDGLGTHWIPFDLCPRKSIAITAWRDGDERQERWDLNSGELLTLAEAAHTESITRREAMITTFDSKNRTTLYFSLLERLSLSTAWCWDIRCWALASYVLARRKFFQRSALLDLLFRHDEIEFQQGLKGTIVSVSWRMKVIACPGLLAPFDVICT